LAAKARSCSSSSTPIASRSARSLEDRRGQDLGGHRDRAATRFACGYTLKLREGAPIATRREGLRALAGDPVVVAIKASVVMHGEFVQPRAPLE
jgi:hypothetical protein